MTARGQTLSSVCDFTRFWIEEVSHVFACERFGEHGDVISACSFFAPTRHPSSRQC